jgi:DNA transposase THAP9
VTVVLITQCLAFLEELEEMEIISLTFDGDPANIKAVEHLGAKFSPNNDMRPFILNPGTKKKIAIFLDMSHCIKLVRNKIYKHQQLYTHEDVITKKKDIIDWKYFKDLEALQTEKGIHLANKLALKHIDFQPNKMKVKLATQLMSESVASSLEYLGTNDENFVDSGATSNFCRIFNNIFDIFNSRSTKQQYFKAPLSKKNANIFFPYMDEVSAYIRSLKTLSGSRIVETCDKTGFVGILINIQSLKDVYARFVNMIFTVCFLIKKIHRAHVLVTLEDIEYMKIRKIFIINTLYDMLCSML